MTLLTDPSDSIMEDYLKVPSNWMLEWLFLFKTYRGTGAEPQGGEGPWLPWDFANYSLQTDEVRIPLEHICPTKIG